MDLAQHVGTWRTAKPGIAVPLGRTSLVFGPIWLLVVPGLVWMLRSFYVPVTGVSLSPTEMWIATGVISCGVLASLLAHGAAHVLVGRFVEAEVPERLPLYPAGDAAQVWPPAADAGSEFTVAAAGPAANLALALACYALWAMQAGAFMDTVWLFLMFANLGFGVLNLAPAFPFDGGRVIRSVAWGALGYREAGSAFAYRAGWLVVLAMAGWAAFLAWQRLRFSGETSTITLVAMALFAIELIAEARHRERPASAIRPGRPRRLLGSAAVGVAAVVLAVGPVMLLPTNLGMEAPGPTASVQPMVHVPPDYAHSSSGKLLLTTVIPQAPIVVGEWLYAKHDGAIHITAAKNIVAPDTTPQQLARQGLDDLQQSEQTAIVVGLNLAGYQASLQPVGAIIQAVDPQSKAAGVLMPGDEITSVNGQPVQAPSDISRILGATPQATTANIGVSRGSEHLTFDVQLTPDATGKLRIGISVAPVSENVQLPFPVTITPEKVEGGPSAGLMFSLAVFDVVTPGDLTNGHKIAGTGTIDVNGNVGAIGGVQQKVAAAERAGAEYFLVPADNYGDAQAVAGRIKVVKVTTASEARQFLETLPPAR